jgi:peptide/bleomycin uptake transporter
MAPSIVAGLLTLGIVRQIGHAFTQVSRNLQYLVQSWPQIVELLSVHKRLREYDNQPENTVS